MPKSIFFPNISRKFTKGVSFSCPRCHRSNAGHPGNRFAKKLGRCYIGLVERPLDCSVAEYGQLALWTGIVGEAPGHAQCPLRGLGMARHSNEGSRQRVGRGGVVGIQNASHGPRRLAQGSRLSGITDAQSGGGGGRSRRLCRQPGIRDSISAGI